MKSDQSRFIHLTTGLVLAKNDIEMWYLIQSYHFTLMFTSPSSHALDLSFQWQGASQEGS